MYGAYNFRKKNDKKPSWIRRVGEFIYEFLEETWFHLLLILVFLIMLGYIITKAL